jgi:SAM-dependent methyltransferase
MTASDKPKSQLDRVEEHFGATALEWQDLYARPRRVNDLVLANRRRVGVEKIREHVRPGARVLDAGCGAGLVALDLVQAGFFVQGVDIAEKMLDLSRARFRAAGIASDRYAFVRTDVSEYQEDELAALRRFNELLEPEGVLVVSGPTEKKLANYLGMAGYVRDRLVRFGRKKPSTGAARVGLHWYSIDRFRRLLEASGLSVIWARGHGFVEFEGVAQRLSYDGEVALHRTLSSLAKVLPIHRWGNDLIVVARKKE